MTSEALRVVRATGMTVDFGDDTPTLVMAVDEIADAIRELEEVKKAVVAVVAARADKANTREINAGKFIATINAPTKIEVDQEQLLSALYRLADEGVIDRDVVGAVVPSDLVYKVSRRELGKLRRHPDQRVSEAIDACETEVPQTRYMRLVAAGQGAA